MYGYARSKIQNEMNDVGEIYARINLHVTSLLNATPGKQMRTEWRQVTWPPRVSAAAILHPPLPTDAPSLFNVVQQMKC